MLWVLVTETFCTRISSEIFFLTMYSWHEYSTQRYTPTSKRFNPPTYLCYLPRSSFRYYQKHDCSVGDELGNDDSIDFCLPDFQGSPVIGNAVLNHSDNRFADDKRNTRIDQIKKTNQVKKTAFRKRKIEDKNASRTQLWECQSSPVQSPVYEVM